MEGWMDKYTVAHPCDGILFSLKREGSSDTHRDMNEPWRIMLNEISQTQKDNYSTIPLLWGTQNSQIHRGRKENRGYRRWREGEWELLFKRTEFQFGRMRQFPRWVAGMVEQRCECAKYHWCILLQMAKMVNFLLYIFHHNKRFTPGRCLEG